MKPCPSGEIISFEALPVRVDSGGVILLLRHGVCLFSKTFFCGGIKYDLFHTRKRTIGILMLRYSQVKCARD